MEAVVGLTVAVAVVGLLVWGSGALGTTRGRRRDGHAGGGAGPYAAGDAGSAGSDGFAGGGGSFGGGGASGGWGDGGSDGGGDGGGGGGD